MSKASSSQTINKTFYSNVQRMNLESNLTLAILECREGHISLSGQHEEMIVVRSSRELEIINTTDLTLVVLKQQ